MGVTKRLALVAAVCAVITALAGFAGGTDFAVAAFVITGVVAAVLVVYDSVATPKTDCIEAGRVLESRLSLNHTHTAELYVRNKSDYTLTVEITDDVPEHFEHGKLPVKAEIPAHSEHVFTYTLKPQKRGEYVFPAITVRFSGILGMIRRKKTFETADSKYRVYPNIRDLSDYDMAALSRNLLVSGIKQVRANAENGEFSTLRQYAEGDNYKMINWAATARTGELTVNTFAPERNQYIYAMIDASRVMNSSYNNIQMLDYAINASFLLADYCLKGGDNFGAQLFAADVLKFVTAAKGPGQFELISDVFYMAESSENAADYERAASNFAAAVKRRSLIFVFTQLFNAEEAVRFVNAVKAHLSRHLVCAITITDPRLALIAEGTPAGGNKTDDESGNGEGGENAAPDVYMRSAALKYVRDRQNIAAVLKNAGIMSFDVEPDKLSLSTVAAYLNIKKQGIL
ncbi:MAG: DUF58 domain-containing protein [Clostridia bacterium]|nr:DUF58 domain-containing protein [Clostridia bacterium]